MAYLSTFEAALEESDCRVIAFVTKVDGKALDSHVIAEMGTKELIDFCGVQCFLNYDCVSYNFGPRDTEDRENICQLNNSTDHKRLKPRAAYTYVETENTCQSTPCLNNGKCQHGFTHKTFRCLCLAGFEGEFCEKESCDAIPTTNPKATDGSYTISTARIP
ncbi:hypothetical protein OS493_014912, partial [Desmophyllum pertusum]